ncbi:hypothetical protein B0J13DRAFT_535579 [Dactylonectria estremocensis]|uniref:Uncharacterized protein n=1 Tax=Dactylonectria estremocensis TaxID=1079267 RepID=A0A9P9JI15_9HYPO|nr:hypothetical protein B0J13DRAFT_535579 [Dactylonectria estremocensis]
MRLVQHVISSSELPTKAATGIIWLCTFTRLGMKHTCCAYYSPLYEFNKRTPTEAIQDSEPSILNIMDADDIDEIQEDQYLALRLDTLVEEFSAKFIELGQPFSDFFWGYWWSRMDEVYAGKDELSYEDVAAIQDALGLSLRTNEFSLTGSVGDEPSNGTRSVAFENNCNIKRVIAPLCQPKS